MTGDAQNLSRPILKRSRPHCSSSFSTAKLPGSLSLSLSKEIHLLEPQNTFRQRSQSVDARKSRSRIAQMEDRKKSKIRCRARAKNEAETRSRRRPRRRLALNLNSALDRPGRRTKRARRAESSWPFAGVGTSGPRFIGFESFSRELPPACSLSLSRNSRRRSRPRVYARYAPADVRELRAAISKSPESEFIAIDALGVLHAELR